jgi:multiple RNA-binding domain-containing protein 1
MEIRASRVIVKNLPHGFSDDKLKTHFAKHGGIVTDAKVMRKHNSQSRRFGFVGFKNNEDAEEAVKYFNGTFINTTRIEVGLAMDLNDTRLIPSAVKKEQKKRSIDEAEEKANKRKAKKQKKKDEKAAVEGEDNKLAEYLNAMDNRQAAKSWANDMITGTQNVETTDSPAPVATANDEDDEEYADLPQKKQEEEDSGDEEMMMPLSEFSKPDTENEGDGQKEELEDNMAADTKVSDMEWLQMRRKLMKENQETGVEEEKEHTKEKPEKSSRKYEQEPEPLPPSEEEKCAEKISQTKRLFLRNLLYTVTEAEIRELFSQYGNVEEVHVPVDSKTLKAKGFAYILFSSAEDAVEAFRDLDGKTFQGRLLHILPAQPKRENKLDEFDLKDLPLKKQRELRRKAEAAKQQFSWNSLYMNSDAVMESVAHRLGVSKADLINPESSDAAVQQALAETSVLNNIRQYFESKGVELNSFGKKEKSDTVILVKNFPYDTSREEIVDLFAEYGDLKKVLMPPDGGIAMVVFKTAPQGRAAFTKLAFRRFKTSILYLEKGPKGLFDGEQEDETEGVEQKAKEVKPSASDVVAVEKGVKDDEEKEQEFVDPQAITSVFIKNLNFKSTSADLNNLFKPIQGFRIAQVKMKPDSKNPGKQLSMGFGFAEFNTKQEAETAISAMDGYTLDGHKLQLKLSHRGHEEDASSATKSKPKSTKILIKNIPFETSKKDVQKLFGTFGQLRSVRVPKKFDKTARGFAFAEFVTAKEAENAMKALQGAHLLGRRLVMDYAQEDATNAEEEIERMEAKVRKQVTNQTLAGMRLSGKRQIDLDDDETNPEY